jgi:hypothetical protein
MTDEVVRAGPMLSILLGHGVEFVVVGGMAGMALGSTYPSYDLDIAYANDTANIQRLAAALEDLGAELRVAGESPPSAADIPFQLDARSIENGLNFTFRTRFGSLDVLGDPGGISSYRALAESSREIEIDGVPVRVCSIDHLIAMKRNAARPKDKLMLEEYIVLAEESDDQGREEREA